MAATASAYTGQRDSRPPTPDAASMSVTVFRNVAISAQASAAAVAKAAARRIGEPCAPAAMSTTMMLPDTIRVDSQSDAAGLGFPPAGSATERNTASATQTTTTADQAVEATAWPIHTRRSARTNTNSVTRRG